MTKKKELPQSLVETRPALADDYGAQHPGNGPPLGPIPVRYSRPLHEAICASIRVGNRPVVAAQMAGLPSSTFHNWLRLGREGDPHLWEFARDVELAEGQAEGTAVKTVVDTFSDDPENAKWWLERGRSGGWSKQVQQLVNGQLEEFMARLEAGLPPEVFQLVLNVAVGQAPRALPTTPLVIAAHDDDDTE